MAIQLRFVMALTIAVVAAVTATVCFAPTYISGVDSVLSAVNNIRTNLVTLASERLTAFFAKPRDLALLMTYVSSRGRLDAGNSSAMVQLSCDIAVANQASFTAVSMVLIDDNYYRCSATATGLQNSASVVMMTPDRQKMQAFVIDNQTHLPIPGSMFFEAALPTGVPIWALDIVTTTFQVNPSLSTVWTAPVIAYDGSRIEVGSRLTYPNGTYRGAAIIDVSSAAIASFLQSLGLREGGRAIAWDDGSAATIGLSWGEAPVNLFPNWRDQTLPASDRGTLRPLDNFTDPLLRRVLAGLGGFSAIRGLPLPFSGTVDSGHKLVFVDVVGVRDAFGLNVKILLAMPQIDFLRDVYQQQVRTLAGVCCGVAAMIGIAFLIGQVMAAPLQRLADRMELTASFNDNEEDDPPSLLAEVASMQASYSLMKGQLNRAKTYLPQSVLAAMQGEDEEDEMEESKVVSAVSQSMAGSIRSPSESARRSETGSSRSGRRRTVVSSAGGLTAGGLNVDLGLTQRCVTVVAFNLQGFMRSAVSSARRCAEVQEAMLGAVQRAVRENKGVVDYFQGDRVLASFNAVTNTVAHGRRALVATLAAIRELHAQASMPLHATAGISSGMALCGNMGTKEMRRFCVVGHAVVQALTLERLTKMYKGVSALMPGWMETDAQLELYYQAVDIAQLPGGGQKLDAAENRRACLLLAPMAVKTVAQDEWMYELKSGDDANPFRHVNAGFRALLSGDVAAAKAALAAREATSEVDAIGAAALETSIARAAKPADGTTTPSHLGAYYDTAVATAHLA